MWNLMMGVGVGRVSNLLFATMAFSLSMCGQDAKPARRGDTASESGGGSNVTSGTPAASSIPRSGKYIGTVHAPLPAGVTLVAGTVIADKFGHPSVFSFSHVRTPSGEMIWLDSAEARAGGATRQVVLAELPIPPLANDERLFMGSCDVRGRLDGSIVAIIVNEPKVSRFTKVREAWRADSRVRRFDLVPLEGVSCEDPDRRPE
jgi:hypothetical protein